MVGGVTGCTHGSCHARGAKCLSSDSMHSSSGVSSTGSLHLSIGSEWGEESGVSGSAGSMGGTVVTATHIYRNLNNNSKEENGKESLVLLEYNLIISEKKD